MSKLYDQPEVSQRYFFPQPPQDLPESSAAGPVALTLADGTRICGFWSHPLMHAPTVLYLHGNGECIADQLHHWPQWAARLGCNIFFVDYPGYALSEGHPSLTGCCQTARAALDYLLDQQAVSTLVLMGRSVGSIFALDAAAASGSPRLRGLILESAIADLKQRLALRVPFEQLGLDRERFEAQLEADFDHRAKLEKIQRPVLVLHTRHDSLVPAWHGQQLAGWAGPWLHELVLFDEGDHNSIQLINCVAYQEHLAGFVRAALMVKATPEP